LRKKDTLVAIKVVKLIKSTRYFEAVVYVLLRITSGFRP